MNAIWNKYRHVIIAALIAAIFGYFAYRVSPLACALAVGCGVCVGVALWFFKKEA